MENIQASPKRNRLFIKIYNIQIVGIKIRNIIISLYFKVKKIILRLKTPMFAIAAAKKERGLERRISLLRQAIFFRTSKLSF